MATASPKGRKTSSTGFRGKEDVVLAILQRELGGASLRANAFRGKRYIAYARCVSPYEAAAKLEEQIRLVRQCGNDLGLVCVGEVRISGVNGITPVMRDDLRQLLARKQERDDFEVLMMTEFSRLTRAGLNEGREIEAEFGKHGIDILYLAEIVPQWPRRDER